MAEQASSTTFTGGPIHTMNPTAPSASAVRVDGERISHVGSLEEALSLGSTAVVIIRS